MNQMKMIRLRPGVVIVQLSPGGPSSFSGLEVQTAVSVRVVKVGGGGGSQASFGDVSGCGGRRTEGVSCVGWDAPYE